MITAADLDSMRETLEDSLPDTAVLQTGGTVSDGGGGFTEGWTNAGTVPCRLAPTAGQGEGEVVEGGRLQPDYEFVLTTPHGTSITEDMRAIVNGSTYTVVSMRSPRSWEISCRVNVKEVK